MGIAISVDILSGLGDLPGPTPDPVQLITADGIPAIDGVTFGAGDIVISLAGTSAYPGDHVIDPGEQAQLATGPVNEIAPAVTGTQGAGQVLFCDGGLWAFDPDGGTPVYSFQWQRDGSDIPGAHSRAYTQSVEDDGTGLGCIVTATHANGSRSASSGGVSAPVPNLLQRVGDQFYSDNTSGTTGTINVDLSAYGAGDTLLIFTGPGEYVAAGDLSVDGVAATKISTDRAGNFGARAAVFEHTLSAAGSATTSIQTVNGIEQGTRAFAVYALRGYSVSEVAHAERNSGGAALLNDLTISVPNNAVVSCCLGVIWDGIAWTGATSEETLNIALDSIGTALATNLPTGAVQCSALPNADTRSALISVLLETT